MDHTKRAWQDTSRSGEGSSSQHRGVEHSRREGTRFQPTATAQVEAEVQKWVNRGWPNTPETREAILKHTFSNIQEQYHQEQDQLAQGRARADLGATLQRPHTAFHPDSRTSAGSALRAFREAIRTPIPFPPKFGLGHQKPPDPLTYEKYLEQIKGLNAHHGTLPSQPTERPPVRPPSTRTFHPSSYDMSRRLPQEAGPSSHDSRREPQQDRSTFFNRPVLDEDEAPQNRGKDNDEGPLPEAAKIVKHKRRPTPQFTSSEDEANTRMYATTSDKGKDKARATDQSKYVGTPYHDSRVSVPPQEVYPEAGPSQPSRTHRDTTHPTREIDEQRFISEMREMRGDIVNLRKRATAMINNQATLSDTASIYSNIRDECNQFLLTQGLVNSTTSHRSRRSRMSQHDDNISSSHSIVHALNIRNALNNLYPQPDSLVWKIRKNINDLYERNVKK